MKSVLKFAMIAMLFVVSFASQAQYRPLLPKNLPSPYSKGYYRIGYVQADSGYLFTTRDTMWRPKFPTLTYWQRTGVDSTFWFYNMAKWQRLVSSGSGGTNLPVDWTLGYPLYDARYAAAAHSHTFTSLTSKPTTLAGYGITDAAASSHSHTFTSLTSKPTTLAGFGITDAVSSSRTITINGVTYDLSDNRVWTIATGGSYTGTSPIGVTGNSIYISDSTGAGGIVTNRRLDSLLSNGTYGFQVAEGLIVVQGLNGNQDTIIVQDDAVTNDKISPLSKIGLLADLTTTDKTSIVAAINEVKTSGSGWSLSGNSITAGNFIGSTNDIPLEFKVNNLRAGYIGQYTLYPTSGSNVVWSGLTPANTTYGGTFFGREAGANMPVGDFAKSNTVFGHRAMYWNAGLAEQNTLVGDHAGYNLRGGIRNVLIGQNAGLRTWSANSNVAVGANTLELNNDGAANTAIGPNAMRSNIDGSNNVGIGNTALAYNTSGILSIPITSGGSGYTTATVTISAPLGGSPGGVVRTATGTAIISGGAVTGITITDRGAGYAINRRIYEWGQQAAITVTITGDGTGAVAGTPVLKHGEFNTAIGRSSGTSNNTGSYNVFLGNEATGRANDEYNTFLGASAGVGAGAPTTTISNAGAWGYNAKVEESNTYVIGVAGQKLAVGRTTASEAGHFNGAIVVGASVASTPVAGTIRYNSGTFEGRNATDWVALSGSGGGAQDVVKIATLTPTAVSTYDVDLTSYIATYTSIEIRFVDVTMGAAANYIRIRTSPDATTFASGGTDYKSSQTNFSAGGSASNVDGDHLQIMDRLTADAGYNHKSIITIDHPNTATLFPMISWNSQRYGWDGAFGRDNGFGYRVSAQITRAIRIYSDQAFTGTIQIWGYK